MLKFKDKSGVDELAMRDQFINPEDAALDGVVRGSRQNMLAKAEQEYQKAVADGESDLPVHTEEALLPWLRTRSTYKNAAEEMSDEATVMLEKLNDHLEKYQDKLAAENALDEPDADKIDALESLIAEKNEEIANWEKFVIQ